MRRHVVYVLGSISMRGGMVVEKRETWDGDGGWKGVFVYV
jgi:hypothetical protein